MSLSSYHVYGSFDKKKRKAIVAKAVRDLRKIEFDALAVRGVSGLIMAPIIAYLLDKHVIVVRKDRNIEPSHASERVESPILVGKYIVFDDFTSSGDTTREILAQVKLACPKLTCVGGYCWAPNRGFPSKLIFGIPSLNNEGRGY